jgi:2-C-methyl-D-erythritol 4-phosphate cytidylyltransferase / 2-C-methyl-D-erythritol 2,4-cyclodiphosphate synthase
MMDTAALIVAAGRGERAGGDVPKQFARLCGVAVIARAVEAFADLPVFVVVAEGQHEALAAALGSRTVAGVVTGGAMRQESVRNGLAAIGLAGGADKVLVHDAARPLLPRAVLDALVLALDQHEAAVPVLPVADTLAKAEERRASTSSPKSGEAASSPTDLAELVEVPSSFLGDTVPRDALFRIQTPQAFRMTALMTSLSRWTGEAATDEAQVVRAAGYTVATVPGDPMLDKITHPEDFARAEAMLASRMISRSATGYDVHRLAEGEDLWLGGLLIPHTHGLSGHSDADVALHAITDAVLGTIGAGDIGSHFPPSDPQWRGASSDRFLAHAAELVRAAGGIIDFVDLTIVCEAPKIGPHREVMRSRIAAILQLPVARISLKATTTERLGFTGRGEGIAAQAIATVRVPEDL